MEDIEKELEEKSIERDVQVQISEVEPDNPPLGGHPPGAEVLEVLEPTPAPAPVKKVKKARSEKQIAAFEKARLKRAEGIASRKKDKEEQKELKKELKKNPLPSEVVPRISTVQEQSIPKPVVNPSTTKEQVIQNHYYYYGVPPPNHDYNESKKKKKKSKRPPTPSSSESESSEEEDEVEVKPQQAPLKQYQPAKYQFSYA
jgi:hypothetical protein